MTAGEDSRSDTIGLYRLFLRREPETGVVDEPSDRARLFTRVGDFIRSGEFSDHVLSPVAEGRLPNATQDAPDRAVLAWACRRLRPERQTRRRLVQARSWQQVYDALFADRELMRAAGVDDLATSIMSTPFWRGSCAVQGGVDGFDGNVVRGWARRIVPDDSPLRLEIWVNGALQAVTTTGAFRHDVAARLGGSGLEGFEARLPVGVSGRVRCEVREASSRLLIGSAEADVAPHAAAGLSALREEISALRRAVELLEARVPRALSETSTPMEAYADYYDRWRRFADAEQGSALKVAVLLDAVGSPAEHIEDAVLSVAAQAHDQTRLVVGVGQDQLGFLIDLIVRVGWVSSIQIGYVVADSNVDWRAAVDVSGDDIVQLMPGDGLLHRAATAEVANWFDQNPHDALYFDEDELDGLPGDEADSRKHRSPLLKPSFDADLLLQTPYPGAFVALRRDAWRGMAAALNGPSLGSLAGCRCLLELLERPSDVGHLTALLASRQEPFNSMSIVDWGRIVATHMGDAVLVSPHDDVLGAVVPFALKIRRRTPENARSTVIIPTRDRLDLLQPCVDSLLARRLDNRSDMNVLIVDHETSAPECVAYIAGLETVGCVQRLPYSGPFNWSLMNNLAARETEADVLVFLNNDTVAISPDWLDALVSEAMRPDVGVVGCRLIYADGAIQHAGFVSRDARDNFLTHEGVGQVGSDAGYMGRHALVHETIAVTGACMAVRRDVFQSLGGFDAARFAVEGNDVDFCFKARKAGLKVLYTPHATLYHLESRTRTFDADDQLLSAEANRRLWDRWGQAVCPDRHFNGHFDRRARPFTRLAPPSERAR